MAPFKLRLARLRKTDPINLDLAHAHFFDAATGSAIRRPSTVGYRPLAIGYQARSKLLVRPKARNYFYAKMNSLRKAARLARLVTRILVTNPRRVRHVLGTALAAAENVADPEADLASFPVVQPEDLLPGEGLDRAVLALFPKTLASVSVLEFVCLILLAKKVRARSVFEFGTYKGVSITQLALNLPEGSRILTLDLPEDSTAIRFAIPDPDELKIALEKGKGVLVPQDLRSRIEFVRQDSAVFDETPYADQIDFVFVDGAHSAEYVKNDSQKGWRMLRPGGIIAWHDCRLADPAVVRYLSISPFRPALISCTSLAFATKV